MKKLILIFGFLFLMSFSQDLLAQSQTVPLPNIGVNVGTSDNPDDLAVTLQLLLLLTM